MAKIYLASSWRNEEQPHYVRLLREHGHQVYDFRRNGFTWSRLDPDYKRWSARQYCAHLKHPVAIKGFHNDFNAMKWAHVGVLLLPCGRSAHLELGWMAGKGKYTIIVTKDGEEPELMAKLADEICLSESLLLESLDAWNKAYHKATSKAKLHPTLDQPFPAPLQRVFP